MEQSAEIHELTKALVATQAVLEGARKDSKNPHYNSKYADLESVWGVAREPLAANGLAVTQTMAVAPDGVVVETQLMHVSGQWVRGSLYLRPSKNDPQGIGSAITYGRRYSLAAILGIHQTDDDGNAASVRTEPEGKPALERPKSLSAARPPDAPKLTPEDYADGARGGADERTSPNYKSPLTLDGELSPEEKWGRLLNKTELNKLFGLVSGAGVSTDDLKTFVKEKYGINSRAEIRYQMIGGITEWLKGRKEQAA